MSIANELSRLLQAKSDLATSITNKGVTVPAATTIDGYAALVDQIQQGGTPVLPYDSKIEYLEATGTQYIDTGILYSVGMTVFVNAIYTANFSTVQILVAPSAAGGCWMGNVPYGSGTFGFSNSNTGALGRSNIRTSLILNYISGKTYLIDKSSMSSKNGNRSTNPTTDSMQIFGVSGNYLSSAKLYSCQIHDANNNVLADFIPVRKGTVGYLYDKISGALLGNAGTGSFTLGPDVT